MGVNPTLPNYKTLTFDNSNSAQYGVYLTGEAVFNAPERAVEMVSIPGRNGAFALDKGHFENIEVKYRAGIFADTQTDFANAISDFRNMLCSKVGYCRLTDDYNPNEYRMAVYKSGLEVEHEGLLTGEFDIIFDCKPQRFLTSGETVTTIASGGKLTNPTLFASRPQLQVYGYGTINLGDQEISVNSGMIGSIKIADKSATPGTLIQPLDVSALNTGDIINITNATSFVFYNIPVTTKLFDRNSSSITSTSGCTAILSFTTNRACYIETTANDFQFINGTSSSQTYTSNATIYCDGVSYSVTVSGTISYNATYNEISYSATATSITPADKKISNQAKAVYGVSTKSALGSPIYIDLDIGEAYNIINNSAVSVNNAVTLPAELPTLPSGDITVTFDNTITKLDVLPRWWKV